MGQCSKSCGGGISKQFPKITKPAQFGGRPCPDFVRDREPKEIPCNNHPCPGEFTWFIQTGLSIHSESQDNALYFYDFSTPPSSLAVDCEWEWAPFGKCSKSCGGGIRSRFPDIISRERHGGSCPTEVVNRVPETEPCNTAPCPGELHVIPKLS